MTRRELRQADKRARRRRFRVPRLQPASFQLPSFQLPSFRVPQLQVPQLRVPRLQVARPTLSTAMAVTVALSAALLGGGASQAYSDHQVRSAQERVAVALAHERTLRVRAVLADGARLDRSALAFATVKRTEAVVRARAAVAQAVSTRASSAADVSPETLTPLDAAMVNLTALIEKSPVAPAAAPAAPATPAAPDAHHDAQDTALKISLELPGSAAAGSGTVLGPVDPSASAAPAAAGRSESVGRSETSRDPVATGTSAPDASAAPDPSAGPVQAGDLDAVDLTVSAELLVAAQLVTDLSAQVEAVAGANVAAAAAAAVEEAARAAAAETARVAAASARAVAAQVARKVAAADDAPNGAIPAEDLCGVSFDAAALLRCDAAHALEPLAVAYRAAFGHSPVLVSSYRSYSDQVAVRATRGGLAAAPGSSNHGRGLAIDFADLGSLGQFSAPAYRWMQDHAGEFGWHHPAIMEPGGGGPPEPWHWEFGTE